MKFHLFYIFLIISCDATIHVEQYRSMDESPDDLSSDFAEANLEEADAPESEGELSESDPQANNEDSTVEDDPQDPIDKETETQEKQEAGSDEVHDQDNEFLPENKAEDQDFLEASDESTKQARPNGPQTFEEPFMMPVPVAGSLKGRVELHFNHKLIIGDGGPVTYGFHGFHRLTSKTEAGKTEYYMVDIESFNAFKKAILKMEQFTPSDLPPKCEDKLPSKSGDHYVQDYYTFKEGVSPNLHKGMICAKEGPMPGRLSELGIAKLFKMFEQHHQGPVVKAPPEMDIKVHPPHFQRSITKASLFSFDMGFLPLQRPDQTFLDVLVADNNAGRLTQFSDYEAGTYKQATTLNSYGQSTNAPEIAVVTELKYTFSGNLDGKEGLDIAMLIKHGAIRILLSEGQGFTSVNIPKDAAPFTVEHIQVVDLDQDGMDNLAIFGYKYISKNKREYYALISRGFSDSEPEFYPLISLGSEGPMKSPQNIYTVDVKGDGSFEILIPFPELKTVKSVSLKDLTGESDEIAAKTFIKLDNMTPTSLTFADLNQDKIMDMGVLDRDKPSRFRFFLGTKEGTFKAASQILTLQSQATMVQFLDLNHDGFQDVVFKFDIGYGLLFGGRQKEHLHFWAMVLAGSGGLGTMMDINQDGLLDFVGPEAHGGLSIEIQQKM